MKKTISNASHPTIYSFGTYQCIKKCRDDINGSFDIMDMLVIISLKKQHLHTNGHINAKFKI